MAEQIVSPGVFQRETDQSFITPAPVEVGAAIVGPTAKGPVEFPTVVTSFADYKNKFGTIFTSGSDNLEFFTSIAAQKYFSNGGRSLLVTRVVSGSGSDWDRATSTHISASDKLSTQPFSLQTIGEGTVFNNSTGLTDGGQQFKDGSLATGSKDNLRWEISGINNTAGTFNLSIRRGDDNTNNKIILETFIGCSLDPKSDNYISKVVGDQYASTTTEEGQTFVRINGEYPNKSKFVFIQRVNLSTPDYLQLDGTVGNDAGGTS
jgi:hypothetical protein